MTKELTLLICCHNGAPYLRKMLESIFDQTLSSDKWKMLILFDACTDRSEQVFEEAWKDLCVIRGKPIDWLECKHLYKDEKRGLANAKNFALQYVETEYVAYLDADDSMFPQRLEKQLQFLEEYSWIDALFTQAWDMDSHGRLLINCFKDGEYITHSQIIDGLKYQNVLMHGSAMVKMEALKDLGFYNESELYKGREDYELWVRMISSGYKFHKLNYRLSIYRLGSSVER